MGELDVNVTVGGVQPLTVPLTSTNVTPIQGGGIFAGWSLRDAVADTAASAEGSAVAPAAGATIVTQAGLAAGTYTIKWTVGLQGPAAAADANNFQLFNGAAAIDISINPGAAGEYAQGDVVITVPAAGSVTIKAIGAGTAGVTYSGQISIIPNGLIETIVEITDGQTFLGLASMKDLESDTHWFGPAGPCFEGAVTLTAISGAFKGCIFVVPNYP